MSALAADRTFVHRRRRGAELALLIVSLVVGLSAYAAVGLGVEGKVPPDLIGYGLWLTGLVLGCHLVVRLFAPYADPVLLPLVSMLNGVGLAEIHRLDLGKGTTPYCTGNGFAGQQLVWMTVGVVLFAITLVVLRDHRILQRFTYTSGLAAIILLLLPMLPGIGTDIHGARIWIHLGPFSFQPGELAKVLLVVTFAGYLVLHRDALALAGRRVAFIDLPRGRDLGPILVMSLVSIAILVRQSDLGSSLLFFGLFVMMLYVSTERRGWIAVGGVLFMLGALAAARFVPHVHSRVEIWLHPFKYYNVAGGSFQLVNGLFGLGWGGLMGTGLGQGNPCLVPFANSDFIVTSIGEELGLTGLIALLLCYGLIVERGLRTAIICRDDFGKLLAVGLATSFALQVFVVVGGVTRLIPLTGLTTPFVSYGGSSLVANWVIVALLLRISDQARAPLPDLTPSTPDDSTQVVKLA